jgi:4-azaleucine resistance transporter AzlC
MQTEPQLLEPNRLGLPEGVRDGFPILAGYFPIAMAFGLLAKSVPLSLLESLGFSIFVFAGASQFMALNLLKTGAAVGEIVVATLLLNFRHLLMSASLAARLAERRQHLLALVGFGITDETFAVTATQDRPFSIPYLLAVEGLAYAGWVSGTGVGYLIGEILPPLVRTSMGIGLYAMFVAILVPQFKKAVAPVILALGAGVIHTILIGLKLLPGGWNLVAALVLAAVIGAFFLNEATEEGC